MTKDDLVARLKFFSEAPADSKIPPLLLAVDTNAAHAGRLSKFADLGQRWISEHPDTLRILVPSLVYVERQAQERRARSEQDQSFELERVLEFFRSKPVLSVVSLDHEAAERVAEWLGTRYPTRKGWQDEKKKVLARKIDLSDEQIGRISMTIDWVLRAWAESHDWIAISGDKGGEWSDMADRKITMEAARAAFEEVLPPL